MSAGLILQYLRQLFGGKLIWCVMNSTDAPETELHQELRCVATLIPKTTYFHL